MNLRCTKHRGWTLSLPALALAAALIQPSASVAAPRGLAASGNQYLLVLDPVQSPEATTQALAAAGFPTTERVMGVPVRHGAMRIAQVAQANAATRAQLLAVPGVLNVRPVYQSGLSKHPVLPTGKVIVKFTPGTTREQADAIAAAAGCSVLRPFDGLPQAYVLKPNDRTADPDAVAGQLAASGQVVYSHASMFFRLQRHQLPGQIDDPLYHFQWHLNNTGQLEGALPGADIKAPVAWQWTRGTGATVGVIDDCLQRDHEDLRDNYIIGWDYVDGDGDPSPTYGPDNVFGWMINDTFGDFHGTCVSGIIAATANQVGVRGVAPDAGLIGAKIGFGMTYTSDIDMADAFLFCERNGAQAINNSWGMGGSYLPVVPTADIFLPDVISDAIKQVATNGRSGLGVLVLFSAGNNTMPIEYGNVYASLPEVMAVGATLRDDTLSCYSDYGPEQSVVAPGGGLGMPLDMGGGLYGLPYECYDSDIATTDVSEIPGLFARDWDFDGFPDPGLPVRGINPPMQWLDVDDVAFCVNPWDLMCPPLVPDLATQDFPNPDYTHHMNGTSAACPVATGVAALVFSVNPNLTAEQVRNLIEHTADKTSAATKEWFDPVSGHNDRYGHGRVNAARAVQAAMEGRNWPSPVKDIINVSSQGIVQLFWTNPVNDISTVLVVRGPRDGLLNWAPEDGIEYAEKQALPGQAVVVMNKLVDRLTDVDLPTGEYQYAIFVRNAQGYYSWGRRAGFGAQGPTSKPLASISVSPSAGPAPLSVHCAGGAIEKTSIVSYHWNFGDGGTGLGAAIDHTYNKPGTYMATLTATNAVGQTGQATAQIVVTAGSNQLPVASILASQTSGEAPLVVILQAKATDADGTIVRYDWNFGDGTVGSGPVVEHIFMLPGIYGVALNVTDDLGGTTTAVQLINVGGSSPTAAATDPPNALDSEGLLGPMCGTGTAGASAVAMLMLAMLVRRRR